MAEVLLSMDLPTAKRRGKFRIDEDATLSADSDLRVPTQAAVKAYVEASAGGGATELNDLTDVDTATSPPTVGDVLTFDGAQWVPDAPSAGGVSAVSAVYEEQQASGTSGGAAVAGSWLTRSINTELFDGIGISLSAGQLTLPAGTYDVQASTTMYRTGRSRARVQDVTNGVTLALSDSQYSSTGTGATSVRPTIDGRFTLAAPAVVELQYRAEAAYSPNGLGVESNMTVANIFSRLRLTKVA